MTKKLFVCLLATTLLLLPMLYAFGQCGPAGCDIVPIVFKQVQSQQLGQGQPTEYKPARDAWVRDAREVAVVHFYRDGGQLGSFRYDGVGSSGTWMSYDRLTDRWGTPVQCDRLEVPNLIDQKQMRDDKNFGLVLDKISEQPKITLNRSNGTSAVINKPSALQMIESGKSDYEMDDASIPDYSKKFRITVIGSTAERKSVVDNWNEQAGELKNRAIIWDLPPDHHSLADSDTGKLMFKTDGHPTVYTQAPDGKVLQRQDDGKDVVEATRRAIKKYDQSKDPDNRKPVYPQPGPYPPHHEGGFPILPIVIIGGALALLFYNLNKGTKP